MAMSLAVGLLTSGCVHLALFASLGSSWHGPVSLRKPTLFGISGGLTIWSIVWLMTQLRPKKNDRLLANSIAVGLFIEVALITLQFWRGLASHFNHTTPIDAAVELSMLGLILYVTAAICYLTFRTFQLRTIEPAMALAIRGGMLLLALSCGLGILTTVLGEVSVAAGGSSELWGVAGVLKFPHGVALHAIQLLPVVAWLARCTAVAHPVRIVQSTIVSQILFLIYAIWQTGLGRDRFDWDAISGSILGGAVLFGIYPAFALFFGCLNCLGRKS